MALLSLHTYAGEALVTTPAAPPVSDYVGGRGLLTIQRPSGLVINPTSGTLPAGAVTVQYCFFLPNNDNDPFMVHGAMASYGVTDWLEVAALFTAVDIRGSDNQFAGGPLVRARLLKDVPGGLPEVSVGGYAYFGDSENYNAFLAAFKNVDIDPHGFLRSVGFHVGIRESWLRKGADRSDAPVGYAGAEIQLPFRFYLVGEVSTTDKDSGGDATPYGFGVQWRLGGINISAAFANPGFVSEPSFFFGIGTQLKF